jgi:hypothetical protein
MEKRPYLANPFPVGSPEHKAERRRRARELWAKNKDKYRKPAEPAEPLAPGSEPPKPPSLPITWDTPEDLKDMLGDSVTLPATWTDWPMYHVRRQKDLSIITLKQYKTYYFRLPNEKDIYDVLRFIKTFADNATRNQFAKSGLSYVSQKLYDNIYGTSRRGLATSRAYREDLHRMMVFSELNKRTKKASYEQHISQEASPERHANTVDWPDWEGKARLFVRRIVTKPEPTVRDKQEGMVAALYSFIPPVRLDWNDVEVKRVTKKQLSESKGQKGKNILYVSPGASVMTWGEFKNISSFGAAVPLQQPLPADLHRVLKKLMPEGDSTPLKIPNFSSFVTSTAETITGKKFSNRLMRSSYIRQWHIDNSKESVDVTKTRAMMKLMHQTNMEVHLAYNKSKEVTPEMAD